jgi:hypothetical protein
MSGSQMLAAILFFLLALILSIASAYVPGDVLMVLFFGVIFSGCAIAAALLS